jgi:hypothetical protein
MRGPALSIEPPPGSARIGRQDRPARDVLCSGYPGHALNAQGGQRESRAMYFLPLGLEPSLARVSNKPDGENVDRVGLYQFGDGA